MNKKDKMVGRECTHLDYVAHLIYPDFRPSIVGSPPPPIEGIISIGQGSEKVFIYVKDDETSKNVQVKLDLDYEEEKQFIEIKIIGEIFVSPG